MAPPKQKGQLDKAAWSWTDTTHYTEVHEEHVKIAYRLNLTTCERGSCKRNCKGNPFCLNNLGEKKWFNQLDESKFQQFNPEEQRRQEGNFAGLKNLGATCYVNTFLQLWFHSPTVRKAVYEWRDPTSPDVYVDGWKPDTICGHLQLIFALMQSSKRCDVDPSPLIECLGLDAGEQQDAQEFSKLFLHVLESSLSGDVPGKTNVIEQQFCGKYCYVTVCQNCGSHSETPATFYELDLNIRGHVSLTASIKDFLQEEKLEGDNQYMCSNCNSKQNATRAIQLKKLPPVLNLQLLRFVFDKNKGHKKKLSSFIQFPESLDMSPYLEDKEEATYNLVAVLIHSGPTAHSGHYIAHIKERESGAWYKFNDEEIEKMKNRKLELGKEDETLCVTTTEGTSEKTPKLAKGIHSSRNAYMLVYSRCDKLEGTKSDVLPVSADLLPASVRDFVTKDNQTFENWIQEQLRDETEVIANKKQVYEEMRYLYTSLPVKSLSEPWEWVTTEWLTKWLNEPSSVAKVKNNFPKCRHGKIPADDVVKLKCISEAAASCMFAKYPIDKRFNGPSMLCEKCIRSECRERRFKRCMTEDDKLFLGKNNRNSLPLDPSETLLWVSTKHLRSWKRFALQNMTSEEFLSSTSPLASPVDEKLSLDLSGQERQPDSSSSLDPSHPAAGPVTESSTGDSTRPLNHPKGDNPSSSSDHNGDCRSQSQHHGSQCDSTTTTMASASAVCQASDKPHAFSPPHNSFLSQSCSNVTSGHSGHLPPPNNDEAVSISNAHLSSSSSPSSSAPLENDAPMTTTISATAMMEDQTVVKEKDDKPHGSEECSLSSRLVQKREERQSSSPNSSLKCAQIGSSAYVKTPGALNSWTDATSHSASASNSNSLPTSPTAVVRSVHHNPSSGEQDSGRETNSFGDKSDKHDSMDEVTSSETCESPDSGIIVLKTTMRDFYDNHDTTDASASLAKQSPSQSDGPCSNGKKDGAEEEEDDNKDGSPMTDDDSEDRNEVFNSDILCQHGNLRVDETGRRLVKREVWDRLLYYFPHLQPFTSASEICQQCLESLHFEFMLKQNRKQAGQGQKDILQDLYHSRNRPKVHEAWLGRTAHVVSSNFLDGWRKFIKHSVKLGSDLEIVNAPLLCEHNLLLYRVEDMEAADNVTRFTLVWDDEWQKLIGYFNYDVNIQVAQTVNAENGKKMLTSMPAVCSSCFNERIRQEEEGKFVFSAQTVYVRKVVDGQRFDPRGEDGEGKSKGYSYDPEFSAPPPEKMARLETNNQRKSSRHRKTRGEKEVTVSSSMTLKEFKIKLFPLFSIAPFDQNLSLDGCSLKGDDMTLQEFRFYPQCVIFLQADEPSGEIIAEQEDYLNVPSRPEEGFKGTNLMGR